MTVLERLRAARKWSDAERIVLNQVRRVANEVIAPSAAHHDRTGEFPHRNVAAINELCLNAIFVPDECGGALMPFRLYLEVVKIISAACASTGIIFATTYHAMKPLVDFGAEDQKMRFLPRIAAGGLGALAITESEAGSDATGMTTRFEPNGDSIVINGSKVFITNGDQADLILLFGKWSEIQDARKAISVLVFERGTPGMDVVRIEHKMGHKASSTAAISFNDCHVPRANLIGEPGDGLRVLLASLNHSRPSIAAHALGIAHAAFDDMVGYINERRQSGRRIIEFQANQFTVADLATEIAFAEVWLDHVARLIDEAAAEFGVEASMAKLRASDCAMRVTTEAVQMFGGYGYCQDHRVERLMRDAKITQIWEGTNQIHRQLIGKSFIRR